MMTLPQSTETMIKDLAIFNTLKKFPVMYGSIPLTARTSWNSLAELLQGAEDVFANFGEESLPDIAGFNLLTRQQLAFTIQNNMPTIRKDFHKNLAQVVPHKNPNPCFFAIT